MIDCFERKSKDDKRKEDLACLLNYGCLIGNVNGTKIKLELDS